MSLELAQIAAGLPMAASLAVAGGLVSLREGRRRAALNEAMHELRRPLQALSLSLPRQESRSGACGSSLLLATAALERLDREINGGRIGARQEVVALEPLLAAAVARWRSRAGAEGRSLQLRLDALHPFVCGDDLKLAQAVDNMISNAIEHGGGAVRIELDEIADGLVIAVLDAGRPATGGKSSPRSSLRSGLRGCNRRGYGLRVVKGVAEGHGGAFELRRSDAGTEARLELPRHRAIGESDARAAA